MPEWKSALPFFGLPTQAERGFRARIPDLCKRSIARCGRSQEPSLENFDQIFFGLTYVCSVCGILCQPLPGSSRTGKSRHRCGKLLHFQRRRCGNPPALLWHQLRESAPVGRLAAVLPVHGARWPRLPTMPRFRSSRRAMAGILRRFIARNWVAPISSAASISAAAHGCSGEPSTKTWKPASSPICHRSIRGDWRTIRPALSGELIWVE
jgi:hypothetical protein